MDERLGTSTSTTIYYISGLSLSILYLSISFEKLLSYARKFQTHLTLVKTNFFHFEFKLDHNFIAIESQTIICNILLVERTRIVHNIKS